MKMNHCYQGDCRDVMRSNATTEELAYCAGVIDSDGTIGVKRSTYAMRVTGDSKQPTFSERICVKQVEPQAVDLLHKLFGGTRHIEDPNAKRGRQLYSWQVTDKRAANCLILIAPFLRIKRHYAKAKELNRVGA